MPTQQSLSLEHAILSAWFWDDLIPNIDSSWVTLNKSYIFLDLRSFLGIWGQKTIYLEGVV